MRHEFIACVRCDREFGVAAKALQLRSLVFNLAIKRIDEMDIGALSRIVAPPKNSDSNEFGSINFEALQCRCLDGSFIMIERKFNFG